MCIALSAFDAAPKIKRIERKEMLNVNCCYGQRETYIVGVKKGCPYSSQVGSTRSNFIEYTRYLKFTSWIVEYTKIKINTKNKKIYSIRQKKQLIF